MTTFKGDDGIVKVGANPVGEVVDWSVTETAEVIEDTAKGDTARTYKSGRVGWEGQITCQWDDGDATGQEAMTVGTSITLNLYPEGDTTGDDEMSGTALISEVGVESPAGDSIVQRTFSFQGTGALAHGTAS